MARLDSFLRLVVEQKASDLHFHAGKKPIIRHDGELIALPFRVLSEQETRRFLLEIMRPDQREQFESAQELDFVYSVEKLGRFRVNCFQQKEGLGGVFRIIPDKIPTIDELSLPRAVKKLTQLTDGIVLVSGPTGSGKTTTLGAMVNEINRTSQRHIITLEDPVEIVHGVQQSVVTQRQIGEHAESFSTALKSALRESPDVVVVGELRDAETMQLALAAAETGVLVMGTLHTHSASKSIDRVIDMVPEDSRDQVRGVLSVLLRGVVAQHLVKRLNEDGRVAVTEVMLQTTAVSNMIREGKVHQLDAYLQQASSDGSGAHSLDMCIFRLVREGVISVEEGMKVASDPTLVKKLVSEVPEEA